MSRVPGGFVTLPHRDRTVGEASLIELDRNGLQILDRAECLRLLSTATLGRIGVTVGALPVVLPVNFCLVGEDIVVRTGMGTKLEAATRGAVVAFEVDEFEAFSHAGWSVVVTGTACQITDPEQLLAIPASRIPRWASDGEDRVVAIDTGMMSGRRILPGRRRRG